MSFLKKYLDFLFSCLNFSDHLLEVVKVKRRCFNIYIIIIIINKLINKPPVKPFGEAQQCALGPREPGDKKT